MPKVTISYECDVYEDQEYIASIQQAHSNSCLIDDLDNWLRSVTKHGTPECYLPSAEKLKNCKDEKEKLLFAIQNAFETCREKLWGLKRES